MNIFTVSFFGHRMIERPFLIEQRLESLIRQLINTKEYVDFLVGRSGDFDQYASSAVLRTRKAIGDHNSSLTLVLPYPTAEYLNNQGSFEDYYNYIEVSDAASAAHHKAAFQIRNREMVDRSDLIVCCIERESGGAWQTVKYAMEQGKTVINLANEAETVNLF